MQLYNKYVTSAVMAIYRCKFHFRLLLHSFVFISVMSNTEHGVSVRLVILNQMHMKALVGWLC